MPILFIVKKVVKNLQKKAEWRDAVRVRKGFERIIQKVGKNTKKCLYIPVDVDGINGEWIVNKKNPDTQKVLLYFHGGGYAAGSINTHRPHIAQIVKYSGIKALLIDYRLAPEHKYPTPVEDAVTAYKWLLHHGYLPEHIAFGGDSAGGGLAVGTLLYLRDNNIPLPKCAICLSPWLDMTLTGDSMSAKEKDEPMLIREAMPLWVSNYMGDADLKSPYASPIFADLQGLPPIYIQVGTDEILLDDSVRFAQRATEQGSPVRIEIYSRYFHVFQGFFRILYKARIANRRLADFLVKHL